MTVPHKPNERECHVPQVPQPCCIQWSTNLDVAIWPMRMLVPESMATLLKRSPELGKSRSCCIHERVWVSAYCASSRHDKVGKLKYQRVVNMCSYPAQIQHFSKFSKTCSLSLLANSSRNLWPLQATHCFLQKFEALQHKLRFVHFRGRP